MGDEIQKLNRWKKIIVVDENKNKVLEIDIGEKDQIKKLNKNKKKITTTEKQKFLLSSKTNDQNNTNCSISNTTIFSRDYKPPNEDLSLNLEDNMNWILKKNTKLSFTFNIGQIDIIDTKNDFGSINNFKINYFNDLDDKINDVFFS